MDWSSLQSGLECTISDVLLLLDSCDSGNSARSVVAADVNELREGGRTELISACGFNAYAYSGEHSFTATLVAELKHHSESENIFSVVGLHSQLLARMKDFPRSKKGMPSTPVYVLLTGNEHALSILLKRLPVRREKFFNYDSSYDPIEPSSCYLSPSEQDDLSTSEQDESDLDESEPIWNEYEMGVRSYARVLTKHAKSVRPILAVT